ncbi:hypothetical protein [Insolitispirillum peregrinum]|uniref:hypothetical protein n=1 Tax=Insolitispirillum peregrinum TaxID=80876 RepID=UPI00360D4B0C
MFDDLIDIAFLSFRVGLIGYEEYTERYNMAVWLTDESGTVSDPRIDAYGGEYTSKPPHEEAPDMEVTDCSRSERASNGAPFNPPDLMYFRFNAWHFTGSDPDPYPSVPHGHYESENNPYPKLNPYTGRVFSNKHQYNIDMKLGKKEMKKLWNDKNFRSFCLRQVIYYETSFPHYKFPVRHPHRFPVW